MPSLDYLKFDNAALSCLPIDEVKANYRRQVPGACFSLMELSPVENPVIVLHSADALALLGIEESHYLDHAEFPEYFGGNKKLNGSQPAAHCYCGHQFGYFSGQLGDGAAIYLGEVINSNQERWELQLKGSGPTPYSRQGDGRKVLRSSLREFLCSEAFHYLGIPTTRAGTCITSDSTVIRDEFYNGKATKEKVTIISRIAPTFLRFGSFEIFKELDPMTGRRGPSAGRKDILITMLDYTISSFYPEISAQFEASNELGYTEFFREIVKRTARLVALWQSVGFCHGVLNTDNMSIVGVTIDYGPFGFMDAFDSNFICNGSDDQGRYSYRNQPSICKWNCGKLAEAMQLVVPLEVTKGIVEEEFDAEYNKQYLEKMKAKLGLLETSDDGDLSLITSFMETMEKTSADFTNSFRYLSQVFIPLIDEEEASDVSLHAEQLASYCLTTEEKKKSAPEVSDVCQLRLLMSLVKSDPGVAANFGLGSVQQLENQLRLAEEASDGKETSNAEKRTDDVKCWTQWLLKYSKRLKKLMHGQDGNAEEITSKRCRQMNSNNPLFVLRNYIAQRAITAAEKGDYSEAQKVFAMLKNPYGESGEANSSEASGQSRLSDNDVALYTEKPPMWALDLKVT